MRATAVLSLMAEIGVLAHHMAVHIVAMNVGAPLGVLAWRAFSGTGRQSAARWLAVAAMVQLALLLGWHLPAVFAFALASDVALIAMHLSLFLAALGFGLAVVDAAEATAWRSVAALLVTAKISCLFGVLLAFAQRPI
jgi:putative membrane protein